jgi:hypothetical protein
LSLSLTVAMTLYWPASLNWTSVITNLWHRPSSPVTTLTLDLADVTLSTGLPFWCLQHRTSRERTLAAMVGF